ncbi:VOC family protein [Siculibacillus lacustris]|uniref:VOC family protein n=1 Tax=Siculibacillus lacustris TaxID=1549641 RepID=A0A4Q9VCQ7_9HYPH|nr:VOC family protein [Siculibacillus lacustris]TBW32315.1 VOC family protein [Siculibacillus lacustris]
MSLRLSMVTLGVADVAAATAFYEALGLVRGAPSEAAVTFFDMDGVILALYGRAALADDAGVAAMGDGFRGLALAWNVTGAAAVDAAIARAVAAGGRLVKAPERAFWGGYSGYFADPDGHLWEVADNPGFPFDERGALRLPEA